MAEWTSVAVQTVNPGEAIVFTDTALGVNSQGSLFHIAGSEG